MMHYDRDGNPLIITSIKCPRCGELIIHFADNRPHCDNCCYPDDPDEADYDDAKYETLLESEDGTTV